jgi:hypothetical protein
MITDSVNSRTARGTTSRLSKLAQDFIKIPYGDYGACEEFISRHPEIMDQPLGDLQIEAMRLHGDGKTSQVRSCVQQFLILWKASNMSRDNYRVFLDRMRSKDSTTLKPFIMEFEKVFNAIKSKAGVRQTNQIQSYDTRIEPKLVSSSDNRRQDNVPASIRCAPEITPHINFDDSLSERMDRLSVGTSKSDSFQGYVPEGNNFHMQGYGGGQEELDRRYFVRPDGAKFFTVGRVFATLWHEPARAPQDGKGSERFLLVKAGRFEEKVFSRILRLVVVKERHGFCWCIPINTYGGQGVLKKGFNRQDQEAHAMIYMDGTEPGSTSEEERSLMNKKPIAVQAASPDQKLDLMSRLNFAKPYSVQWNLKVMHVGKVTRTSMPVFINYWLNEVRQ